MFLYIKKIFLLFQNLFLDKNDKIFISFLSKAKKNYSSDENILIQIPNDRYYLCYYKCLFQSRFINKNIYGFWPYFLNVNKKSNLVFEKLKQILVSLYFFFLKKKWEKLYKFLYLKEFFSLDNIVFKHLNSKVELKANFMANKIFAGIHSKEDVYKIKIGGIYCGDLIYDTYIRYRVFPTVYTKDKFLRRIIYLSIISIFSCRAINKIYKFKEFYTSYSCYIQHGIFVRTFLKLGVKVYSGFNNLDYNKILTNKHYLHTINYKLFKKRFLRFKNKKQKLSLAKNIANDLFSGKKYKIPFFNYMAVNPYQNKNEKIDNKINFNGVIFLPNFFESQTEWGKLIFPDFYTWLTHTLNLVNEYSLNVAIKPHPNALYKHPENIYYYNQIKFLFKNIPWINPEVSNNEIFKKIKFGISPYGSILWELSYHNKIAISAGDYPGVKYNFAYSPKTVEQYDFFLKKNLNLRRKKINKTSFYEFIYMFMLDSNDYFHNDARKLHLLNIDFSKSDGYLTFIKSFNKLLSKNSRKICS
jgi:hypothetical protein